MKKLWIAFALVLFASFFVLGWIGTRIHEEMPPLVNKVVTTEGTVVIDAGEISAGQNVWQIARRHGSRLDLGTRQLRRSRLDGGLAASRSRLHPRPLGQERLRHRVRETRQREAVATERALGNAHADQHLRPGHADGHGRPRSCRCLRVEPRSLLRRVRQRQDRLCHSCRCRDRQGSSASACGVFLLDLVGRIDQSPERSHQLHEQLAVRAVGRQSPHGRSGRLDRREHHHAAGRNLGDGVVVCLSPRGRRRTSCAGNRSARHLGGDSFATGDRQILLGRLGSDSRADAPGRHRGALRRRRGRLLRIPAFEVVALQRGPNVAHSDWACSGSPPLGWQPGCSSARW